MNTVKPNQNEESITKQCADSLCENQVAKPSWCKRKDGSSFWSYRKYCSRCNNLHHRYGIRYTERTELLAKQNGLCKICNTPINFSGKEGNRVSNIEAVVDHCHSTNQLRGILCGSCNVLLGKANDSITLLENAIKYLKENETSCTQQTIHSSL